MFKLNIKEAQAFVDKSGASHFEAVLLPLEVRNNYFHKSLDMIFAVFHDQAAYDAGLEPLDMFKIRVDQNTGIKSIDVSGNTIETVDANTDPTIIGELGFPNYDDFWRHFDLNETGLVASSPLGVYFLLTTQKIPIHGRFGKPLGTIWEYITPTP